jgi:glycerol-3-phosphate acyltransferase PlsY
MVSLSSVTAATVLTAAVALTDTTVSLKIVTLLLATFVVFKHRENIKRIMKGEESRVEFRKPS